MLIAIGIATLAAGLCFGADVMSIGYLVPGICIALAGALIGGAMAWLDTKVHTVYGEDGPYLTRMVLGRLRLHIFWRGDTDPDPHDHPWSFWTFPLVMYEEDVVTGPEEAARFSDLLGVPDGVWTFRNVVTPWRWHYRPATYLHRVIGAVRETTTADSPFRTYEETGKPIITIVWTEKANRDWAYRAAPGGSARKR